MEYVDVVNDKDQIIGIAGRDELYTKFLSHRIVHVLIFNRKNELALQLRSRQRIYPLHWGTTVGGHVQTGETYIQAAIRECQEEIGVILPITFVCKMPYQHPDGFTKFLVAFHSSYDGPFTIDPEEGEAIEFFSIDKIATMIAQGQKFMPELLFLLQKHYLTT